MKNKNYLLAILLIIVCISSLMAQPIPGSASIMLFGEVQESEVETFMDTYSKLVLDNKVSTLFVFSPLYEMFYKQKIRQQIDLFYFHFCPLFAIVFHSSHYYKPLLCQYFKHISACQVFSKKT
ncbi:MAG: hypothetical protein FWG98_03755 [Candidatus Cloacimonetes bacterium]|nr:hypothetical protein [Candidatus Cloacimonadota bacterium]